MGIVRKTLYTESVRRELYAFFQATRRLIAGIDTKIPVINAWQDRAVSSTGEPVERSVLTRCEFGTDALTRWDRGESVSAVFARSYYRVPSRLRLRKTSPVD